LVPLKDGTLRVSCVVPNSPAAEQGIVEGDVVTKINGIDVSTISFVELRELFSKTGLTISLLIVHESSTLEVKVVLKRLI